MKKAPFLIYCLMMVVLVSGCNHSTNTTPRPNTDGVDPSPQVTHAVPSLAPSEDVLSPTITPVVTATSLPTAAPTIPPEARLKEQCLEVAPAASSDLVMNGVVVLLKEIENQRDEIYLLDLATGKRTKFNNLGEEQQAHSISPNRERIAYVNFLPIADGEPYKREVVIADSSGKRLKVLPWSNEWVGLSGWLDNQRLVFLLKPENRDEATVRRPVSYQILDPFTLAKKGIIPKFPDFLYDPSVVLPDWEGGNGVVFNSALTLAIYPQFLENDKEKYTLAIWDLSKQQIVTTLKNIFTANEYSQIFPIPRWSPDGLSFVLQGHIITKDRTDDELFLVKQSGQAEQLTHLSGTTMIWDQDYSWSPDGQRLSMIIGSRMDNKARLAVLDMATLDVTDYCLSLTFAGSGSWSGDTYGTVPSNAIWSPDGRQLLVQDWYLKEHRKVIVVDTQKGVAVQIAEDMEPIGWIAGTDK
jgi:Tol biopolymer transport system component